MSGFTCFNNINNTCYINSALVILNHIERLKVSNYLDNYDKNNVTDIVLYDAWKEISDIYWSKNCVITPYKYVNINMNLFKKKNKTDFLNYNQCDSLEYIIFFLESIHNCLKQNNTSIISDMFEYEYKYVYLSENKDKILFENKQKQWVLFLNIPQEYNKPIITINDCISYTFKEEHMENENAWLDDKDNIKKNIYIQTQLCRNSYYLIVQINRWILNKKNRVLIHISEILDSNIIGHKYELFGIINHEGNINNGHYYSCVKKYNKWFIYNDNNIQEVKFNDLINDKIYCLLYKKLNQ